MQRLTTLFVGSTLLLVLLIAGTAAAGPAQAWAPAPERVATFSPGSWGAFAEGMAADSHGNLYASLTTWGFYDERTAESNIGELWEITPAGAMTRVATMDLSPYGMLLGVAVDRHDHVYVAVWDMGAGMTVNGVCRLENGTLDQVVALPEGSWPNGLAYHDRRLYISDSALGAIWKARIGSGVTSPSEPWVQSDLLAPGDPATDPTVSGLGVNGIAFRGDRLYSVVADYGRVVRVLVRDDGSAGDPVIVCERAKLRTADGIALDIAGGLWIAVNSGTTGVSPSGALYRLTPGGNLTTIADDPGWMNYPTQPVFGTSPQTRGTLFVENGAYYGWEDGSAPEIQGIHVGISGLPLR
jgi:sugar lactone lactonase YvrE